MIKKLLLAIAAGVAAAELTRDQQRSILLPVNSLIETDPDIGRLLQDIATWIPPASAEPYLYWLHKAEIENGLPENLLVRVAYQESRFREDIINGTTTSSAGALGIMQIVPRWHPNVDPLNVEEAINYAAKYLAYLRQQTGSWQMALAAYNWGIGNLKNNGFEAAPTETKKYVMQIAGDVLGGYA